MIPLLAGNVIYRFFDDGLANILGLETFRHGTNLLNYCSIRLFGGDPKYGGKYSGSTVGWVFDETDNYFYLFKDNEFGFSRFTYYIKEDSFIKKAYLKRYYSKKHCYLSSYNFTVRHQYEENVVAKIFRCCIGYLSGFVGVLITPTLHFRFRKIDHHRFEEDPAYAGYAYKTSQKAEAWRIGILGSLFTGINLDWFSRVRAAPIKILTGVVQLTCAVALAVLAVNIIVGSAAITASMAVPFGVGVLLA